MLRPHGYHEVKLTHGVRAPMSGASGVNSCSSTSDYHVSERNFGSPGYSGVTVHVYECEGLTRIAVISSTSAEQEAREVRALIQADFSAAIDSGVVESDKRYRTALE